MNPFADTVPLPLHARVVAGADVWMEGDAVHQFVRVASSPGCVRAVAMPDLHAGRGIPIGAVFAFADRVLPSLIGGDAGCGARVVVTAGARASVDTLVRRVERAMKDDPLSECDAADLFEAVWVGGVRGLAVVQGVPGDLAALAAAEPADELVPSGPAEAYRSGFEALLGTAGGGNHFVEIARVDAVEDELAADRCGAERGSLVVLAHSGSRGLGGALGRTWHGAELQGEAIARYLGELAGACRFARANRFVLAYRMLRALGAARADKIRGGFDVTHNDVAREPTLAGDAWVHRKGASPARGRDLTVVLGSRGARSWILEACDDASALRSVAHGAGRKMGRNEARAKLGERYHRADLVRTKLGGRVLCDDPSLLYEEHPDAYKPIDPVIASLTNEGLARAVASLVPLVTVKQ